MRDTMPVIALMLVAVLYGRGALRLQPARTTVDMQRVAAFISGLAVVGLALVSPLHGASERRLSWHMVQHLLLVSVAAPLLAVGRPSAVLAGLTDRRPPVPTIFGARSWPAVTTPASVGVLLGWHLPWMYEWALRNDVVHDVEHISLLATAFAYWHSIHEQRDTGLAVLWIFAAMLPATALGFAMTLAAAPWYETYASRTHADALHDQQIAGVVMWSFGGLLALIAALSFFVVWLRNSDRVRQIDTERVTP
jgi:cytochrome c oxidase assembly factor CtaG